MRRSLFFCAITIVLFSYSAKAKRAGNSPYVQATYDGGFFYARCIPAEKEGSAGKTEILRVRKDGDEVIDRYEWYNGGRIRLGWTSVGKIAVMRLRQEEYKEFDEQIELSFYLGGKFLKSYSTSDLIKLGADTKLKKTDFGPRATYIPIGFRQVPKTKDCYFEIDLENGTVLKFNALNGKLCRIDEKKRVETKPSHTTIYTDYRLIDIE